MVQRGLREVTNPSELLVSQSGEGVLSGTAIGVTLEACARSSSRTQALVSMAAYGTPQRSVTGFDAKRMNMLLAVLEKRVGSNWPRKMCFSTLQAALKSMIRRSTSV